MEPAGAGPRRRAAWGPGCSLPGRRVPPPRQPRNARLGFPEPPRHRRDDSGSPGRPAGAAAGMAGSWATVTVPGAAAGSGRSPRAQLSTADTAWPLSGSEGPRSAHARRPAGCSSELQAKFSAVPLGTGRDSEWWPPAPSTSPGRGGAGTEMGVSSSSRCPPSPPALHPAPARVLGARLLPTGPSPGAGKQAGALPGPPRPLPGRAERGAAAELPASRAPAPARVPQATAEVAPLT